MWIARDSDNSLWLFVHKPVRIGTRFEYANGVAIEDIPWVSGQIDEELFDEVTWDNSPVELKLVFNEKD